MSGQTGLAKVAGLLLASAAAIVIAPATASAAEHILTGTIASASGEKLGGVTVSARRDGTTITTSVYTDETGNYYFPPLAAIAGRADGCIAAGRDRRRCAHEEDLHEPVHRLPYTELHAAIPLR